MPGTPGRPASRARVTCSDRGDAVPGMMAGARSSRLPVTRFAPEARERLADLSGVAAAYATRAQTSSRDLLRRNERAEIRAMSNDLARKNADGGPAVWPGPRMLRDESVPD